MKNIHFTQLEYNNATVIKLNNKRVVVQDLSDNDFGIQFRTLCSKEEAAIPAAYHGVEKDVLKITAFRISEGAAVALYSALGRQLGNIKKNENLK